MDTILIVNKNTLLNFLFLSIAILDILAIKVGFNILYIYLVLIISFYLFFKNVNIFNNNNKLTGFSLLFILYLILNHTFVSLDKSWSFQYTSVYSVWLFILVIFLNSIQEMRIDFIKTLKRLHLFLLIFFIISFIASIITLNGRMITITKVLDFGGLNPNVLSYYITLFLLLTFILHREQMIKKSLYKISILVFILCLFYARSRGIILSLMLASSIFFFIQNRYLNIIKIQSVVLILILIYLLFIINGFELKFDNSQILKLINSLNALFGNKISNDYDVSAGRFEMYNFGFLVLQNIKFFLVGVGLEAYRSIFDMFGGSTAAYFAKNNVTLHSVPLQHLVGLGLIGFAFYIYIFKILWETTYKIHDYVMRHVIKFFILFIFISSFFSDTLLNRFLLFYLPIIAIFYSYKNTTIANRPKSLELKSDIGGFK